MIRNGQLTIVHKDVLELQAADLAMYGLKNGQYTIVANIPYYITGEFLRNFLGGDYQPQKMVIMVQKEVAKRIVASPINNKPAKESILSMSVKAYGKPTYIESVPARYFRPEPKVDSAVLLIDVISKEFFKSTENGLTMDQLEDIFFKVVKAGFAHKRKVLIKNLEIVADIEELRSIWKSRDWSPTIRAEDVNIENWKMLSIDIWNGLKAKNSVDYRLSTE